MKKLFILGLVLLCATAFAKSDKGNGGDVCESQMRNIVNEIDLWLGHDEYEKIKLPASLSEEKYKEGMSEAAHNSILSCTTDKVFIAGVEKTCSNFIDDNRNNQIVCNFDRFINTSEQDKYMLIHHELAGVAGFESNGGKEKSNYTISNQISDFLRYEEVLKLGIKSVEKETIENQEASSGLPELVVKRSFYKGNYTFDVEIALSNSRGVKKLVLDNKNLTNHCYVKTQPRVVLAKSPFILKLNHQFNPTKFASLDCTNISFDTVIVEYNDGRIEMLKPFDFYGSVGIFMPGYHHYASGETGVVKINRELLDRSFGSSKSGLFTYKTKTENFKITYNVSADDLKDYRGVFFDNGEEFLSEEPQELANFINSRQQNIKIDYVEDSESYSFGCGWTWSGACLVYFEKPVKNKFQICAKYNERIMRLHLITKDEISQDKEQYVIYY